MDTKKMAVCILALVLLMTVVLGVLALGGFLGERAPVVGLCLREKDDAVWAGYYSQLQTALEDAGYAVELRDASNDQAMQNLQIDNLLQSGCRLFVVEPVMVSAAEEVVSRLESVNASAVFIGNEPDAQLVESYERICYVGSNPLQPGMLQGQVVMNTEDRGDINGDGIVSFWVLESDPENLDVQLRSQHCDDALRHGGMQIQRLMVSDEAAAHASARIACTKALQQFGKDIEVIFCSDDKVAIEALAAIEEAQRNIGHDIYLVGADATDKSLQLVATGKLTGTVLCDYQGLKDKTLEVLGALRSGSMTEKRFLFGHILVDGENVSDYAK